MASVAAPAPLKGPAVNGSSSNGASAPRSRMSAMGPSAPQQSNSIPLSARKSVGLDLSTVERRGQPNAAAAQVKPSRPHGLQEAPTYYPTEEEFRNGPLEYIRQIAEEGTKYGIVKIVPPEGWSPPFAIDTERFHFRTRKQELNLADGGTRANLNYLDQLAMFHKQRSGAHLNRFPSVDKRPLDLYKLKKFVEDKGGFDRVCKDKRWAEIGRDLGYSGKIMSSLSTSLKNSYQKWLQPYEDWLKQNRPQVLQEQERQNGGPYTPSPANTPGKSNNSPMPAATASPAMRASQNLAAALQDPPKPIELPPAQPQPSGFTAVNSFTPVNSFTAVNTAPSETESFAEPAPSFEATNGSVNGNGLKRAHSEEESTEDSSGRRSKRVKQDAAPTVTGSQMIQPRIAAPKATTRDKSNDKPGDCDVCGRGDEAGSTISCESCDISYHRACLDGPLRSGADADWHCPRCLVGTGEFGFEDGGIYSLKQFQERAHRFKERHFAKKLVFDPVTNRRTVSEEEVEREFWRLTESLTETVEVEYGADIHSTTHGSGFDTIERQPFSQYSIDPWNLNVMPLDKDSLFRYIKTDISGMTVPWLYVGMCFSTFCWHNEDHYTYSANYQHFGETKTWYGIPSGAAEKFETAMRDTVPELFEQQPDLLFQLVTLLQPEKLRKAGVSVYALDQRAGEFVITFPQAYHAGFNHGFNFNEAVNFAPPDWEPYGAGSIQRLQDFRRQAVFSHDELLFSAAARDHSIKTARWLGPALDRVMQKEFKARDAFKVAYQQAVLATNAQEDGQDVEPPVVQDPKAIPDDETVCGFCKAYGYLSRFVCKNTGKILCLLHAPQIECCSTPVDQRLNMKDGQHELRSRMNDEDIQSLVQKVLEVSKTPESWQEKLDALLGEDPKPSLKSLRSMVTEGERIDASWPLEALPDLKAFVARCNAWVEEATAYIARKPNRRKSEIRSRASLSEGGKKKEDKEDGKKDSLRNPENIRKLLKDSEDLSFDCPELEKLQERADRILDFKTRARAALKQPAIGEEELDELIEEGKDLEVDISEMKHLDTQSRSVRWFAQAKKYGEEMDSSSGSTLSLNDVVAFIEAGKELNVADDNQYMMYFRGQKEQGEFWEAKALQVMSVENVNFQQLDALFNQASKLPVSPTTLAQIDEILKKQREAQEKIMMLYERTKELDLKNRPKYREVRDTMESLSELNSKPPGTMDLEKEQKRHEDWMRRGKKLFGKANAPLRILLEYMQSVADRNDHCFDLKDQPRMPVEPASREASPDDEPPAEGLSSVEHVFCICRKPESGMMIECELCHEW
jgi:histone demethylase JARID1